MIKKNFLIVTPHIYLVYRILSAAFFTICFLSGLLIIIGKHNIETAIYGLSLIIGFGSAFIGLTAYCKIYLAYDEGIFVYHDIFGRTTRFVFYEILYMHRKNDVLILHLLSGKKIKLYEDWNNFLQLVLLFYTLHMRNQIFYIGQF